MEAIIIDVKELESDLVYHFLHVVYKRIDKNGEKGLIRIVLIIEPGR